jgi:hypothetical protein
LRNLQVKHAGERTSSHKTRKQAYLARAQAVDSNADVDRDGGVGTPRLWIGTEEAIEGSIDVLAINNPVGVTFSFLVVVHITFEVEILNRCVSTNDQHYALGHETGSFHKGARVLRHDGGVQSAGILRAGVFHKVPAWMSVKKKNWISAVEFFQQAHKAMQNNNIKTKETYSRET